jgi:nucleotide-binding universal stress UspA family protein
MFSNILLAVDGSTASRRAARHGIELAKALAAKVTVLTVTVPWETYFSRELAVVIPEVVIPQKAYDDKRDSIAACILQDVVADAHSASIQVRALHRCDRDPWRAIIEAAKHEGCDLIIMGSHCEPGFTGALLGSETMKVLAHTSTPVLVYRHNQTAASVGEEILCATGRLDFAQSYQVQLRNS